MKDPCVELLNETLMIHGSLTQETVMKVLAHCEACLSALPAAPPTIKVNFSAVTHCDSASLALLTALCRLGRQVQREIKFVELPEKMLALASVCEVEKVLPVDGSVLCNLKSG